MHINTTQTKVFRLDAWRSWLEPVNAVGGCNFTDQWHETAMSEVDSFCKKLRQAKIKYRCVWSDSSNVFMKIKFICFITFKILDMNKTQEIKHAINVLDEAYSSVMSLVRSDDDHETINLIQPILDKIDEIQNEIEEL